MGSAYLFVPRLDYAARRPGASRDDEGSVRQNGATALSKGDLRVGVQGRDVGPGRPDPAGERFPPGVEGWMLQVGDEGALLDVAEPGGREELGKMSMARAGKVGLIVDARVQVASGPPEQAERTQAAGMIPDTGGDDPAGPRDTRHLGQPRDRICHEVHDELRERGINGGVRERQMLGTGPAHVDARIARRGRGDERLRRVHGRHGLGSDASDQLGRERPRPTADVEHSLAGMDRSEIGQLRGEQDRVPAHEAVVRIGGDIEAHERNLPGRRPGPPRFP